ncbi:DUF3558 domain-containing protein [Mycobacteroides immunogenum]|uniref:DUF3558 domain-containing protein n=1 Tax=Mycobacteroides immunogenum TaxID=83262 RepID=UPI000AE59209|nr:DUF3558 domain-containing protein [Mycobacteroides immunogenum]
MTSNYATPAILATAVYFLIAGCGSTVTGQPAAVSATGSSSSHTPAPLSGVSPPTTAAPNENVTGTTFDACASITDTEAASWELKPETKFDTKGTPQSQTVRGCIWKGTKWYLKVYAGNGSISHFDPPQEYVDRQEPITIGSRTGWLMHSGDQMVCAAVLPSEQGIVTVEVSLTLELTNQRYDQCPLAKKIMTTIEPRIP